MKMLLEYRFQPTDPWPPYLCGPIQIHGGHIYYPYCDSRRIYCRKIAPDETDEELSVEAPDGMGLPKQWLWFWQDDHLMLGYGEHCLDLEGGLLLTDTPFQAPPLLDETKEARLSDCILRCNKQPGVSVLRFSRESSLGGETQGLPLYTLRGEEGLRHFRHSRPRRRTILLSQSRRGTSVRRGI